MSRQTNKGKQMEIYNNSIISMFLYFRCSVVRDLGQYAKSRKFHPTH